MGHGHGKCSFVGNGVTLELSWDSCFERGFFGCAFGSLGEGDMHALS